MPTNSLHGPPSDNRCNEVEFYTIHVGHLTDGGIVIAIAATTSPGHGELITQDLCCERTSTLADAVRVIARTIARS